MKIYQAQYVKDCGRFGLEDSINFLLGGSLSKIKTCLKCWSECFAVAHYVMESRFPFLVYSACNRLENIFVWFSLLLSLALELHIQSLVLVKMTSAYQKFRCKLTG